MDRATVNRILRQYGARCHASDSVTGWYLFGTDTNAYVARDKIPFATLFQGEWPGPGSKTEGYMLIVYFDRLKDETPVDHSTLSEDHRELADDIRAHVWTTFDSRMEFNANDIGRLAHVAEQAILDELAKLGYGR